MGEKIAQTPDGDPQKYAYLNFNQGAKVIQWWGKSHFKKLCWHSRKYIDLKTKPSLKSHASHENELKIDQRLKCKM